MILQPTCEARVCGRERLSLYIHQGQLPRSQEKCWLVVLFKGVTWTVLKKITTTAFCASKEKATSTNPFQPFQHSRGVEIPRKRMTSKKDQTVHHDSANHRKSSYCQSLYIVRSLVSHFVSPAWKPLLNRWISTLQFIHLNNLAPITPQFLWTAHYWKIFVLGLWCIYWSCSHWSSIYWFFCFYLCWLFSLSGEEKLWWWSVVFYSSNILPDKWIIPLTNESTFWMAHPFVNLTDGLIVYCVECCCCHHLECPHVR